MPQFTLTEGSFGRGPAAADLGALHLPDPGRPGATLLVPFREVAEMVMAGSDHSDRLKNAMKRGVGGLISLGPAGIAAGVVAIGKAPATVFTVRLEDGRGFTARAPAAVFAELHAAQLEARASIGSHPADAVIAKYLAGAPIDPAPKTAALPPSAPAQPKPAPQARPRLRPEPPPFGRRAPRNG